MSRLRSDRDLFHQFADIARNDHPTVTILSGEVFEYVQPERLSVAVAHAFPTDPDQTHFITYLRPHFARLVSHLGEDIKLGWAGSDPAFHLKEGLEAYAKKHLPYAPRDGKWADQLGENYHLRPVIRSELANGSLLEDLFTTVLGPDQVVVRPQAHTNESLSVEDLMRMRIVHAKLADFGKWDHHTVGWTLAQLFLSRPNSNSGTTRLRGHKAAAEKIRALYLQDARDIDQRFFDGRNLFETELNQSVDAAAVDPQSLMPQDWLSADEIRSLETLATAMNQALSTKGSWKRALRRLTSNALLDR